MSLALAIAAVSPGAASAVGPRAVFLGRSAEGRPIIAYEVGDRSSTRRILVVGCIHGDESAGIAIARRLEASSPSEADLWVVPVLNPDGLAAGTRGNARGVDLNRNFPWRWRPLSGVYDSGPRPLSEPESRVVYQLIERVRPTISIWFHQHLGVVDESGGSLVVEHRFASLVALPLVRLTRYPGSVTGWQNHSFPGTTAFVVELPSGQLVRSEAARYARGVLQLAEAE
jgi:murein peptide amidase A